MNLKEAAQKYLDGAHAATIDAGAEPPPENVDPVDLMLHYMGYSQAVTLMSVMTDHQLPNVKET